jgi:acetyl esterase
MKAYSPLPTLLLLSLLNVWLTTAATAAAPAPTNAMPQEPGKNADAVRVHPERAPDKTIVFKQTPQGELKLHLYLPKDWKASDTRPGIVFWFGGGFVRGTPAQFYHQAEYFAGRGLVCACAEYRVKNPHGTGIDKCIEDARSAMRWVKTHHAELGIDPERVIASGGSAGGTLALLVTLGNGPDGAGEDTSVSLKPCALVLFNPALGEFVSNILSRGGEGREALAKQLSPLNAPQKGMPPAIFFFGTADRLMEPSHEFCEKALTLGNRCEFWTAAGMPHSFFNRPPWHDSTLRKADEFLTVLGYLKGEPQLPPAAHGILKRELPRAD